MSEAAAQNRDDESTELYLSKNTKYQYGVIHKRLALWLKNEHPQFLFNGKIMLPLTKKVCMEFLDHESVKKTSKASKNAISEKQSLKAPTSINACRSAIVSLYKIAEITMEPELSKFLCSKNLNY
jgi:hypothetical protein